MYIIPRTSIIKVLFSSFFLLPSLVEGRRGFFKKNDCEGLDIDVNINVGGLEREALVHLPPSVSESAKSTKSQRSKRSIPLLLSLHALGSGPSLQRGLDEFDEIADNCKDPDEQFIVVYPEGYAAALAPGQSSDRFISNDFTERLNELLLVSKFLNERFGGGDFLKSWNAGGCCTDDKSIDDIAFFRQLISHIEEEVADEYGFTVDSERIYVTGMSNGGFMTNRVACEMSDIIAAAAPVAGVLYDNTSPQSEKGYIVDQSFQCQPDNPVPLLHIHGENDEFVPYSDNSKKSGSGMGFPGVDKSVNRWRDFNNVAESDGVTVGEVKEFREPFFKLLKTQCTKYANPSNTHSAVVEVCIHNGVDFFGHCWPSENIGSGAGSCKNGIGSQYIWDFLKQHTRKKSDPKAEL